MYIVQFIQVYGNPLALLGHLLYSIVRPVNGADMWTKLLEIFQSFTSCWPNLDSHIFTSTKPPPICNIHHSSNDLAHGFLHSFPGGLPRSALRSGPQTSSVGKRSDISVGGVSIAEVRDVLKGGTKTGSMSRRIYGTVPRVPGNMFKKWGKLKWCQPKDKYMKEHWRNN